MNKLTNIELANADEDQLYHLKLDKGEKNNLRLTNPGKVKELAELLKKETQSSVYNK